ncbi:hypothetical protein JCM1841_005436 [Sporobolomyces salmonicolor]
MAGHSEQSHTHKRNWRITVLISGSGSNLQALLDALSLPAASPLSLQNCTITAVLSSRSDAYGLTRARNANPPVPAEPFPLLKWKKLPQNSGRSRQEWEQELAHKIRATRPDLVVLAGWMLILSEPFLKALVRDWDEDEDESSLSSSDSSAPPPPSLDPSQTAHPSLPTPGSSPYPSSTVPLLKNRPIPIINLHPALPGQFPGAHAIQDAWEAFNTPDASTFITSATQGAKEVLEGLAPAGEGGKGEGATASTAEAAQGDLPPRRITKTGIMIHRVIPLLDAGAPVVVKEIPMIEGESLEDLETRIHEVEHVGIVEAVRKCTELLEKGEWWEEEDLGRE